MRVLIQLACTHLVTTQPVRSRCHSSHLHRYQLHLYTLEANIAVITTFNAFPSLRFPPFCHQIRFAWWGGRATRHVWFVIRLTTSIVSLIINQQMHCLHKYSLMPLHMFQYTQYKSHHRTHNNTIHDMFNSNWIICTPKNCQEFLTNVCGRCSLKNVLNV